MPGRAPHSGWTLAAAALAWLAGTALQLAQPALWPRADYVALSGAAAAVGTVSLLLAVWGPDRPAPRALCRLAILAALAGLAFGSAGWRGSIGMAERLPHALEGQDVQVTGVVAAMTEPGPAGLRFTFETESALLRGQPVALPRRLALGWYDGYFDDAWLADARSDLRPGQRWRLTLRLKRPHGAVNPGGFDSELWALAQGVGATGHVRQTRDGAPAELLAEDVAHPVERARQRIRDAIVRQVADARAAGVLAALVVGDQAAIDRDDWELFRNTGVAHLVAISGVHITMLAWLAALAIGRLWRLSPRLMLALPAPLAAQCGGVVVAAGYALLAGWGVPAQRTVVMLASVAALRLAGARWAALLHLLLAAVVVTAADPLALLQAGFWLSFAAVGLLLLSSPATPRRAPTAGWRAQAWVHTRGHLHAQLVATLGLAPLSLLFFQQVSLVGLVANLLAIPFVTLLVTPLALLGVLLPPLWTLDAALLQLGVAGLAALARLPAAVWSAGAAPPWALACGLLAALLVVLPLPWRVRWLALPLALPLIAPPLARPAFGRFELVAADIGQGTAVLVRTRAHLLVYDTGPQYSADADAVQRVLLPLLRARGERSVDLLLLSHRDNDHVGGAARLLAALPVRALSSSLADDHPLRHAGPPHRRCDAGQRWVWDGVAFEVLHPTPSEHAAALKSNAVSCVLRVADAAGRSALLTGDIEAPHEAALLARSAQALASQVLLVPHHGSNTSSSEAFVAAVAPQVALIQAGYRSRFGHPTATVLARYRAHGTELVRSDRCGAWQWSSADATGHCLRLSAPRWWYDLPAPSPAASQPPLPR